MRTFYMRVLPRLTGSKNAAKVYFRVLRCMHYNRSFQLRIIKQIINLVIEPHY